LYSKTFIGKDGYTQEAQMWNRVTNVIFGVTVVWAFSAFAFAQNAKPPAATPAKLTADSHQDLAGVWSTAPRGPLTGDQHGSRETLAPEVDHADRFGFRHSAYPMQPWAKEKFDYNKDPTNPYYAGRTALNPYLQCMPEGPTAIWLENYPFEIIQSPKRVLILFEENHEIRQIWMDGRQHPKDFGHNWMGHSIGHWDGDTLVVDTIGLNDKTWLDYAGHVHSDQLHLIEKFTRVGDKMTLNITFDDPKAFTEPWSTRINYELKPTWDLEEHVACEDRFLGRTIPLR
jgi:hypothetical protein